MSDSPNVYKDGQYVGFRTTDGLYVIRCGECCKENWVCAVSIGSCYWCGWDGRKWDREQTNPNEQWGGILPS